MAGHAPPIEQPRRGARAETSAWFILIGFFLVFCTLVAAVCIAGWRYYTEAMVPVGGALVRVHAPAGVNFQDRTSTKTFTPSKPCGAPPMTEVCQALKEGDLIQAKREAGYGPVASVVLPNRTQIDMWAHPTGAELTLTKYAVSRWTRRREEVELTQTAGYARYDLPAGDSRPYDELVYTVSITGGVSITLAPGGSYSVDVPHYDRDHPPAKTPTGEPMLAEIATRTGRAEVRTPAGTVVVEPGKKVQIDTASVTSEPIAAVWEIFRDADFAAYAKGDDFAWHTYSHVFDTTVTEAEKNGKIEIYRGCRPETPSFCGEEQKTANIAQFSREGNQPKSFGIGILQNVDVDISEYRALRFSMWARVIRQSVPNAGIANIECPVTVELWFRQESPSDEQQTRSLCVYQIDPRQPTSLSSNAASGFKYQGVPPNAWYHLSFDLRDKDLLPEARYLQRIRIYANGHDYISEITSVSLVASQ